MGTQVSPSVFDLTVWSNPWHSFRHDQAETCTEVTGFVGTREFDLNSFKPCRSIPANRLVIHCFLGLNTGRGGILDNSWVSRTLGILLAISSLAGLGIQASNWNEPVEETSTRWQSDFEAPKTEFGAGHRGVDIDLEIDSKIKAPASGTLYFKGLVVDREVVTIRTTDGYLASFEPACTDQKVGAEVKVGEEFAWHCEPQEGYAYHCESCVHFSARSEFGYISPDYLLGNLRPSYLEG